jgi:predicted acylesterase/phospholipase RssA
MHRALVLSGGGAKGSWQVGACEHLVAEKGIWFDIISGVSVGAINGTTLAHARDLDGLRSHLERLRSVWFGVRGNDNIYRRRRFGALGLALGKWGGLYDTTPLREEVLGREIDPAQVAASPIRLRVGYVDLRSRCYRTAGNDHPRLRDAVLASCAMPVLFPPVHLPGSRELGVDGGVRSFAPLADALRALAELPPENDPAEVWVMQLQRSSKVTAAKLVQKYLRSDFPSFSLRAEEPLVNGTQASRAADSLLVSGVIHGRPRELRLRVLRPAGDLAGSVLDFDPAKIRAWYEDGLRTARGAQVADPGKPAAPGKPPIGTRNQFADQLGRTNSRNGHS